MASAAGARARCPPGACACTPIWQFLFTYVSGQWYRLVENATHFPHAIVAYTCLYTCIPVVCLFAAYHQTCQPTISSITVSTSRRADALPPTGSVHLVGQGRPGYNRWKKITGAQSTRCGHRRRIARFEGRYTTLAGQAQQ